MTRSLFIDNDAFIVLACADLLDVLIEAVGATRAEVSVLPQLEYQLRKKRLQKLLGPERCELVLSKMLGLNRIGVVDVVWLDAYVRQLNFDEGEVSLLYYASRAHDALFITKDRRAIEAIAITPALAQVVQARLVCIYAALLECHLVLGSAELRRRLEPHLELDKAIGICFRSSDEAEGLTSYLNDLARRVGSDLLWMPRSLERGGGIGGNPESIHSDTEAQDSGEGRSGRTPALAS